ncbi:hypothetical protein Drose_06305 [Dactylosporangium roseum]|uniref:Uncharacterized protein n=1 Tax=Dactylosporangium roseum TaxID=47989 RepID=A0ABY5Z753_9ACTN|nr:hypothetical protein [Dactylosporangium roseum]UWZ37884.1 hypothetical protein Drose_06305 [Dactylosporangium roseum]
MNDTYASRHTHVRGRQWLGDNDAHVRELCPDFWRLDEPSDDDPDATAQLLAAPHSTWVLVRESDWVVTHPGGGYVRMTDEQFVAAYEPVVTP